jgi:hypothetical protein
VTYGHCKCINYCNSNIITGISCLLRTLSSSINLSGMFRQAASQVRRFATPLFRRGGFRPQTTGAQQSFRSGHLPKPFWNSGKVLLFSTVTGTTTYYYGVNDETPRYQLPGRKFQGPQYASKRELEKVICHQVPCKSTNTNQLCRLSKRCDKRLVKTQSAQIAKTCIGMDIQNGRPSTLTNFRSPSRTLNQRKKSQNSRGHATSIGYQ